MRKQILAISLGLLSASIFAQKKEIKALAKAVGKNNLTEARTLLSALEARESTIEEKYKAQYYYLKGAAIGTTDVEKAAEAYNTLFEIEKAAGKDRYSEEAKPRLNNLTQYVSQLAIKQYNEEKNFKAATNNFYLTYKLSPTDTVFLYNAAVSASLAKDFDTALNYYKNLQEIGYTGVSEIFYAVNKETGVKENLGSKSTQNLMVKGGTHKDPSVEYTKSKQGDIIKNIGYIYINQGKDDEAMKFIQQARKNDPKDLNLILNEAQLYIKMERMDKFGELMKEAIALDPTNPILFFNLGVVNQNEGNIKEATEYYKKAIELKPDYGDAYMNLAITILAKEQAIVDEMNENLSNFKKYDELQNQQKELYKQALPYLEKADELGRTADTVKTLLNIYDVLEMTDKADVLRPIYKKLRG